jgi:methylenetetrahydrofolate dehydrogenase (NADP+) / methenyltetrahydrofolate cyclohydrolase
VSVAHPVRGIDSPRQFGYWRVVAQVLDGKSAAGEVRERVKNETAAFKDRHGITPGLATVIVGNDPASKIYVSSKHRACEEVGFASFAHELPAGVDETELLVLVDRLNADRAVHGILVQLPLPDGLDAKRVIFRLSPEKDVDGLHPVSQGRLLAGEPGFRPCTPLGVMDLVRRSGVRVRGKNAVVVGRSLLVGKPVALLLLEEHATVTVCHSRTADLAGEVGRADVLVAAIGKPEMIRGAWIRPGSVVIDVGINRTEHGLKGDVEYAAACERAGFITPVPGGVGPMTVAMLLQNTLLAAARMAGSVSR